MTVPASIASPIVSEYFIPLAFSLAFSRLLLTVFLIIKSSIPNILFAELPTAALTAPADTLGFTAKVGTKKEDVGKYFNSLGEKIGTSSAELEEATNKVTSDIAKGGASKNPIREIVNSAKGVLDTLKGYLESLGQVGDANLVGKAVTNNKGVTVDDNSIKKALKALQEIVKVAKGENISEPRSGSTAVKLGDEDNKEGVKILSTNEASEAGSVSKAVLILS